MSTTEGTTMADEGYQGWKNYETWVTALWIDNEEGTYKEVRELVRSTLARQDGPEAVWPVADAVKEWAEELFIDPVAEDGPAGLHVDLLRSAWGNVDWHEIARNWIDEVREEDAQ